MPNNKYEEVFKDFVKGFGGEVLPSIRGSKSADYLFRKQNVVAELKCLMEDQTDRMNRNLSPILRDWIEKNKGFPPGLELEGNRYSIEIRNAPKEIQDEWLEILKGPLSDLMGDANRQIRATIQRESLDTAKGLVLIFNAGNFLHNRPKDFRTILVDVLRKRTEDGKRRFPHIHAVVYFSYETVKTHEQNMSFWADVQLQITPDEDVTPMQTFQKELQQAWYAYIERTTGRIVRQHLGE